jgi:Uma2 family endonuclease
MLIEEKLVTADAFWEIIQFPENAGRRLELVEGVICEMSPAGGEHGEVAMEIGSLIRNFVKAHNLGRVTAAETGTIIAQAPDGKNTVRGPDVGFISRERAPQPLADKFVPIVPDLAVEVVSPWDRADDIEAKVQDYLLHGVQLVWVVYPSSKTIIMHTTETIRRLNAADTLDGGTVLPGFTVTVGEIFPQ